MKKKWKSVFIICAVLFIVSPILVACFVSMPILEWVSNTNDWIGFWASYCATIISMVIPIGLFYCQRDEDRKQAVLPVINAYQRNGMIVEQNKSDMEIDYLWYGDCLTGWVLKDGQHKNIKREVGDKTKWFYTELLVKNIGSGPAIGLRVNVEGKEKKKSEYKINLASGETALYKINIEAKRLNNKEKTNKLIFEFSDVYKCKYEQDIVFGIQKIGTDWTLTNFYDLSELRTK